MAIDAHEVYPGLWQGSRPVEGSALANLGFRGVVLCAMEHQPTASRFPGLHVVHAPNDDDFSRLPTREELATAIKAARTVASLVSQRKKVLVTCHAGRNRSGLVSALAIHFLTGKEGLWCVKQITAVRPGALRNPGFQQVLANLSAPSVDPVRL